MSGKSYQHTSEFATSPVTNNADQRKFNNPKPVEDCKDSDLTVRFRVTPLSSPLVVKRRQQAEADAPREMPRGKRERVHRHYSKVLSMALSALYDGQPKNFPGRDYIEYNISALGYDAPDEWAYITDEDLILSNMVSVRVRDDAALAREIERIQKQRARLNEWQAREGNPILIEFEAEYDQENKVNRSRYKRPICELVRDIIKECPVGTPDRRLRVVVAQKAAEYLERFDGSAKTTKRKREHSADSDASRAATFALGAYRKQETKSGEAEAELLIRNAFKAKFGPELYGRIFAENENFSVASKELNPESRGKTVGAENGAKTAELCCAKNIKPTAQSAVVGPVIVGQSVEDFCAENWPESKMSLPTRAIGTDDITVTEAPSVPPTILASGCDSSSVSEALSEESQPGDEIRALDAFRSVGCEQFEWFYLTDEAKKQGAYHKTTGAELAEEISEIVRDAEDYGDSFIVRVRGPVLQLDDCESSVASLLQPYALATFETSQNNYQVWLAFREGEDKAHVAERIFRGVKAIIPSKINPGAGGAIRWPGSINQKPERNGWRVRIHSINPGRFVTPSELADAGLLKEPTKVQFDYDVDGPVGDWPDYQRCLEDKGGDRSAADAQYTYFALKRRINPDDLAAKLAEVSDKAKESGESYINRTITSGMKYLGLEVAQ